MRALVVVALTACTHRVPVATTANAEHCIADAAAAPLLVAPHGDRVGVCFGEGDCFVVDHRRGVVVEREAWPHPEQAFPPALDRPRRQERFELERTETETSVCEAGTCRTLTLPGVADQQTVMPAISVDGSELYFVAREGEKAFLDTIGVDARARRLGRVPLAIGNAQEQMFSVDRVGSAVVIRASISLGLGDERSTSILVDPLTGAQRVLLGGTAVELDDQTAIVLEGRRASIVKTRGLATVATHDAGTGAAAGVNAAIGVVAFAGPPTIVTVENHRFTRTWRLPVCR